MDFLNEFNRIMNNTNHIALATSINNIPNVRIVNFYYDNNNKKIYFSTFNKKQKAKELNENNTISITTIPMNNTTEQVRIHNVKTQKINTTENIKQAFVNKFPDYKQILDITNNNLDFYEIPVTKATIIIDVQNSANIEI